MLSSRLGEAARLRWARPCQCTSRQLVRLQTQEFAIASWSYCCPLLAVDSALR